MFSRPIQDVIHCKKIGRKYVIDTTNRLRHFQELIAEKTSESIEQALDDEPYPNVKCPFGCWCFIEDNGHISFQHLLNYVIPSFTTFDASFTRYGSGVF